MEINDRIKSLLEALEEKFKLEGQEMESYLEGLLHADYLNYWDYI
nr:tryptophan 2,3-dioxygenase [Bacteroidota bacterium]